MPALTHGRVKNGFNGGRRLNNATAGVKNRRTSGAVGSDANRSKALVGGIGSTNKSLRRVIRRRAYTGDGLYSCNIKPFEVFIETKNKIDNFTNDNTPTFSFNSNSKGTILSNYGFSSTNQSVITTNSITFNALADKRYDDIWIYVKDPSGNLSNKLMVPGFTVDTVASTVANVTSTTNDTIYYKSGEDINIQIKFNETIKVTGTPTLELVSNTTTNATTIVNYSKLTTTTNPNDTMNFTYTVQAGDTSADLDYAATTSLVVPGGSIIADLAQNSAIVITLPAVGAANSLGKNKAIVIDTTKPTVTDVTSTTNNGSYKAGDDINISVVFDETITVTGTPTMAL